MPYRHFDFVTVTPTILGHISQHFGTSQYEAIGSMTALTNERAGVEKIRGASRNFKVMWRQDTRRPPIMQKCEHQVITRVTLFTVKDWADRLYLE